MDKRKKEERRQERERRQNAARRANEELLAKESRRIAERQAKERRQEERRRSAERRAEAKRLQEDIAAHEEGEVFVRKETCFSREQAAESLRKWNKPLIPQSHGPSNLDWKRRDEQQLAAESHRFRSQSEIEKEKIRWAGYENGVPTFSGQLADTAKHTKELEAL